MLVMIALNFCHFVLVPLFLCAQVQVGSSLLQIQLFLLQILDLLCEGVLCLGYACEFAYFALVRGWVLEASTPDIGGNWSIRQDRLRSTLI